MAKTLNNALTDILLRRYIAHKEPVVKADGQGLTFTLSKAGTASWTLRFRLDGKQRELTIGNYPDISLGEARTLARQHRVSIDQGIDPAKVKAERKLKARTKVWTVAMLAEDYRVKQLLPELFAEGTLYYRNLDLKNAIVPKLGKRPVASIAGKDIVQMIQDNKDTWTISKRVLTTATKLFDHAAGLRIIDINPCIGIRLPSLLGPRPPIKQRVMLQEADLRTLLATIDTLGTENSLALRLLLATCVRGSELVQAKWEDVDLDKLTWYVPKGNTKMRKGFYVPIAPTAAEWFKELRALAGDSPFVLPARNSMRAGSHIDPRTLWAAITRAFDTGRFSVRKFTPHDTRSTAKGHMSNMGIPDYVSELALNHVLQGMQAIYDVRTEIPEKRDAMNRWASYLETLMPSASATGSN